MLDKSRSREIALLVAAAGLLTWGIARAIGRREPALASWTTWATVGLLVAAIANSRFRSRRLATPITWVSGLFAVIVLLAAVLSARDGAPPDAGAAVRAFLFFVCVGAAGRMQARSAGAAKID